MTIDDDMGYDQETGKPKVGTLSNAVQCWAWQNQPCTVAEAAAAFKVDGKDIIEACEWSPWLYVQGPDDDFSKMIIEHDGE